jgi:hypothetical protein
LSPAPHQAIQCSNQDTYYITRLLVEAGCQELLHVHGLSKMPFTSHMLLAIMLIRYSFRSITEKPVHRMHHVGCVI